ncbi:MAG: hypothetical protein IE926_13335, partial [Micrococcales bacterium]|nr:hypothetical protein [Micrococcales bacterium]
MAPQPVPGAPTPAPALASSEPPAEPARRLSDVTLPPPPPVAAAPEPVERVGRGLAVALLVVLGAGVLAVVVWNLGYVASVTSVVLAAGAVLGYAKAAGAPPRRGMLPLLALIVLGVVGTALALVGWDASQYYSAHAAEAAAAGVSRASFVWENITDGEVLGSYAGHLAMYFVLAALGTVGVIVRLVRGGH